MPTPESRRWLTIAEAAEHLGSHPDTIRRLISRGELRGYRMRGVRAIRVDRHELDTLLSPIPTGSGHVA